MSYATVRAATSPELAYLRTTGQWSRLYLAFLQPPTVYTARLASLPSSYDKVAEISFTSGSGTLANVFPDMTLYVGSTAGAYDLGIARVRKSAIAGTFYIGEESEINWQTSCYLTVVADFDLWAKHIRTVSDDEFYIDYDVAYTNQNGVFDPIPIMGGHRVVKLTGASVSVVFDFSNSYVIGSTITGYSCSCPTASGSSGMTTATPTITFNTPGWHPVYLTPTAANGKTFMGVRYVYVYSSASMPATVFELGECSEDYETGGWAFTVTMQDQIALANVSDRSMCILFAEEFYGDTKISIGQLAGCENIICVGKVAEESISINPELGEVTLRVQGYQYWFTHIQAFPTGVIQVTTTPTNWVEMQSPTVDKVAYRLLHWGCTATRIMDIYLTNDTKIASELISPASNLWAQLQEITITTIFAKAGVDQYSRLFVEVEPQLVSSGSRSWATVMTLTKSDWQGEVHLQRVTVSDMGMLNTSGVVVDSSGNGSALFSLTPGHVFKHYGSVEAIDRLLLSTQNLSNEQGALLLGWRNNPFPNNEFQLSANNRMIDCFPRQKIAWSIAIGDTPRAFLLSGNFIPRRVSRSWNKDSGFLETSITLELESVAGNYTDGDIPGNGDNDLSKPPKPPAFPELPDFGILLPIDISDLGDGYPPLWICHETGTGFIYTLDFNAASPEYLQMNSGLSSVDPTGANWIGVCPSAVIYGGRMDGNTGWLARAASLGSAWALISIPGRIIMTAAVNPNASEQIAFVSKNTTTGDQFFHVGTYSSYSTLAITANNFWGRPHSLSYFAPGGWLLTTFDAFVKFNAAGTAVTSSGSKPGLAVAHIRAGASNILYAEGNASNTKISVDNIANITTLADSGINIVSDSSGINYLNFDCDPTGQFIMTKVSSLGNKNKSSDYGATWASLSSLPAGVQWCFAYAGMNGSSPRFVAANAVIRATPDFGSTWETKENSSLTDIAPFPNINVHKFVGLVPYGNP